MINFPVPQQQRTS